MELNERKRNKIQEGQSKGFEVRCGRKRRRNGRGKEKEETIRKKEDTEENKEERRRKIKISHKGQE